jgi:hypothetical protein
MPASVQFQSLSTTTDSTGHYTGSFGAHIDAVVASPETPDQGADSALIGGACHVTGDKSFKGRLWRSSASPDDFSVQPAASENVVVTVIGLSA